MLYMLDNGKYETIYFRMECLTDMGKIITQTAVFFKGALLMELLMVMADLSCLMAIIIKER